MIKKSTYTRAFEACEIFFTETGQIPTIDAIKPLIGVNSPSTISSAIKEWKLALSTAIKTDKDSLTGVPEALTEAVNACWQQALEEARQVFQAKVEELHIQQRSMEAQEAALHSESERIQHLLQLSEQHHQKEIGRFKKENDRLTDEARRLTDLAEHYRSMATDVEKDNAVLKETIRQEQEKVQRLEIQYDKEHDWALRRIEEEKESHRLQTLQEMTRCHSETKRSQQDLELLQAKFDKLVKVNDDNRERIIELERRLSDEKLIMSKLTLNAAQLQKELNDKDEHLRLLLSKSNKRNK
jgi:chromosome segregation ATPase